MRQASMFSAFYCADSRTFNQAFIIRWVAGSTRRPGRQSLIEPPYVQTRKESFFKKRGWTMAFVKRALFSKTESSLVNQTALFSVAGLFISLALVVVGGLRIDAWV
jgi:hypothetical protein